MSTELKQAAQDAAEAIDWLLKNIRLDAPQLSGKAMGNAEKCASALRAAIQQADSEPAGAREALERIASWSEHPAMLAVDYGSNGVRDYYRKIALDALTRPATGVPDGWQLVPIEPTAEMLQAALKVATPGALRAAWARMLAASPEQKS